MEHDDVQNIIRRSITEHVMARLQGGLDRHLGTLTLGDIELLSETLTADLEGSGVVSYNGRPLQPEAGE